jgi:hypothetical protein
VKTNPGSSDVRARPCLVWSTAVTMVMLIVISGCHPKASGTLLIAFPRSSTELRLVFSEAVDPTTARRPDSYATELGLRILGSEVDPNDPTRVTLKTSPMPTWQDSWGTAWKAEGTKEEDVKIDVVRARGVRTASGAALEHNDSPRFIEGVPSVRTIQSPKEEAFPFTSKLVGLVATHEYNPDGGTGGNNLINKLGFMFLHRPSAEGSFNSIKVVTRKQVPGLSEAVEEVRAGKRESLHVMWAGGEIQTVDGETRLVDTGFMEGHLVDPPLKSPPPFPIKTVDISEPSAKTLKAKSLQGVVCSFQNVIIDKVSPLNEQSFRAFVFHDDSGASVNGLFLDSVRQSIRSGQKFSYLRGIVHQPHLGQYEVIVEMDEHLRSKSNSGGKPKL